MTAGQRVSVARTPRLLAAVGMAGAMALSAAGAANAQPAPEQCSPAALMRAHAATMNQMADYLDAHPDVEQVFADARGRATPQERHDVIEAYTGAHPDVAAALRDIHRPMQDLRSSCGLPGHPGMGFGPMGPGR